MGLLVVLLLIASEVVARQPSVVDAAQPTPARDDRPTLVYSTYYGSTDGEERHSTSGDALAIDASGHAYITGMTSSEHLPLKDPYDSSHSGSLWDGFIAKLDPTGSALVYGTYFGGGSETIAEGIAVDAQGNIYLTGSAYEGFQPRNSPIQAGVRGDADAFVAKFSPDGADLVYAALLGGSDYDSGQRVAVDAEGYAYITGVTRSADFPTVAPLQAGFGGPGKGDGDAFVAKIAPDGSRVVYATYLGGGGADAGSGIAVDGAGAAYVTGFTASGDFPTFGALQPRSSGPGDTFVAKITPDGSSFDYSTYLSGGSSGAAITVDAAGNAYVVGTTSSHEFPLVNPVQSVFNRGAQADPDDLRDAFVAQIAPDGSRLVFATYLGGSSEDRGLGIGRDAAGNLYVGGQTSSFDFPLVRPLQDHYGGDNGGVVTDSFIAKLAPGGGGVLYSTYFGGVSWENLEDLAVDPAGNVYFAGEVLAPSPDFPLAGTPFQTTNRGIRNAFVAKIADDFAGSPQPFPTLTPTPQPTGPDRPPPGFERRWLDGVPCAPPCWEGITPGRTTLTDAVRLLQESPAVQPQTVLFRPWGQPEEGLGYIEWDWRGSEGGGQVLYDRTQGEAVVTDISPYLDISFTLGDVIAAYGEPTHIHATGFYGMHGDGPFYTATFYYEKHGMVLESNGLYHSKPTLGPGIRLDRVSFSTQPVRPQRPTFAAIADDPSTGPQPWQGFKDFDVYCRNTSMGAEPGSRCPDPRLFSSPAQVIFLGAILVGLLLVLTLVRLRSRRPAQLDK
ncbi:MAG TPA: SBBP repeat-containing protein [Chloroflexia bacterium]|nr:SBBP repeat-containing protein [Chloroflexia bacterium]